MRNLSGLFPALLTPFDHSGKIDESALRKLTDRLIRQGVTGFYVGGSTGEAFLMTPDERKRLLSLVIDETKGRAAVICHVGAIATHLSLEIGRHAAEAGADAVSSIPPFYYKFSAAELIAYYMDLAEIGVPVVPYNFPALSNVTLTVDLVRELRSNKNIVGIKFTSNDFFQLERMKAFDPGLLVYNGFDEMFLAGLSMGAEGAIGSTYNFMPARFQRIQALFKAGKIDEARAEQGLANEVIDVLLKTGKLLNAEKYLLGLQGIPYGECRKPFAPLTEADKAALKAVFDRRLAGEMS